MFDRLIESNSVQAEFKPRRKFFMVSSVIVGIAFLSAVVIGLYAKDIDLGNDSFEIAQLLAPVATEAPEPEPPRQQPQARDQQNQATETSRQKLIARIDDPQEAPTEISTTPNLNKSRPEGLFKLDLFGPERDAGQPTGPIGSGGPGSGLSEAAPPVPEVVTAAEPPPVAVKPEPRKPVTQTKGVVNGYAVSLPKPVYPPSAVAINVTGNVNVQVLIDEKGNVVSAKAVTGHFMLKAEAERAAWKAKFKPTYLSDEPVKVTGVIVYRFMR